LSSAISCVAALAAAPAGRVGENGTGAMWIAPELVAAPMPVVTCGERSAPRSRELVFERLLPGAPQELPPAAAAGGAVTFEWNSETGELSFASVAPSGVFDDLERGAVQAALSTDSCGPR
jgi:hypothetical protein